MTDSPGQVSLLRSVETGDLSLPKDRIWLSSDQLPLVQLLHHLSEPSRSHKSPLEYAPLWHPKSRACPRPCGLPRCHGISVKPSGRLPSCLANPTGSLVTGTSADTNALATTSFRAWCLAIRPGARLQTKACVRAYYYYYYYYHHHHHHH